MSGMAFNTGERETLNTKSEKPRLHLSCENLTTGQNEMQDVKLCRICFTSDGNLYSMMKDKNLDKAYETLTGLTIESDDNMPSYLCSECCHQLMHCIQFRNRSLQAHVFLLEILRKHDYITTEIINNLNECQDVNNSDLIVSCKSEEQYDMDTTHIKKESVNTDDETCVKNESGSFKDGGLDGIKKEVDYISGEDDRKADDVYSPSVHEDVLLAEIKTEKDDGYMELSIISGHPSSDSNMVYIGVFEGDDGSKHNIPVREQKHRDMLSIAKVNEVTKAKTVKDLKQKSGERLLLYDNLCCDKCSYKTVSDVKLLRHLKSHSSRSYKCNYTNKISPKTNSSEEQFSCHVCNKTYRRKWDLQKHMKTHSGEKQHTCDVCKKGFNENRDLQNHLRTHSGEKPFGCDLCKKSFSERGNLLRHIRIHAGEKPYSCKVCKISFNQKHHLKRHLTRHY